MAQERGFFVYVVLFIVWQLRSISQGVGQSVRSLKCPGQSVRRESQSARWESQSVRGRSPPRSMCYKHRRSRPSGTYELLAVGSIETYIFYFHLTSIHIIYKVAKPNHNVVGPGPTTSDTLDLDQPHRTHWPITSDALTNHIGRFDQSPDTLTRRTLWPSDALTIIHITATGVCMIIFIGPTYQQYLVYYT